ncbi:hypothetical protein COV49_00730 [Candidatus Falkowbacteria bacterium CG11_big_fil_rev_8_21_14_0_20_39_10]|uniref:ParB-like N-terminal domain-containing protein n=1 Tax=Candidatus Falkowbacteria bacterium CG11_big_fil_rev_8_21_14_0_20_39_10 TaxID=1974570 RepID=A0A2M6K9W9_9BACT|nr:MAG: hypothetical protein COV49_00730 [Candidatus Falkowbacteria bacterium CG11_big_fil_rev_8_21_14_0_20_39_10]
METAKKQDSFSENNVRDLTMHRLKKLLADIGEKEKFLPVVQISVNLIDTNPNQPRKFFDEETINSTADTIESAGDVEEPIKVTSRGRRFLLIDGERRLRAARKAGIERIACKIYFDLTDEEVLQKSIISNFCREPMSLIEQAFSFRNLMEKNGWSQARTAKETGVSQFTISNALKVFHLHEEIQTKLLYRKVDPLVALYLASYKKKTNQLFLLGRIEKFIKESETKVPAYKLVAKIREMGEEEGFELRRTKKGRKQKSAAWLKAAPVFRGLKKLEVDLGDFLKLSRTELAQLRKPSSSDILTVLKQVLESMEDTMDFLKG